MATNVNGMRAVALGTAGGPKWWGREDIQAGISTAIDIDGHVYMVDVGSGAGRQLRRAGYSFADVEAIFITHMHSDHTVDLSSLLLIGHGETQGSKIRILGPGNRGELPPLTPRAIKAPAPISPSDPTPGIATTFDRLVEAYATDINDRMFDYGSPSPATKFAVSDIALPFDVQFHPNDNVAPEMEPFTVFEDERVKVSAILVDHHPTSPAFAFRFDSKYGAIVISGDTGFCSNVVRIAENADILFHEVIDLDTIEHQAMLTYTDPVHRTSVLDHHRRAHTTAEDAGRVAEEANVKVLALHHLVPADAPPEAWLKASNTFKGRLIVPSDLEVLDVESKSTATKFPTGAELQSR